jgi:hypothetical protein
MHKRLAITYGVLIGTLGLLGLFVSGHLFAITNSDLALDLVRIALAGTLLYVGFQDTDRAARAILGVVGVMYVGMGLIGLASPTLGGILPSGLTGFDIAFHLITGAVAGAAALMAHPNRHSAAHA